MNIFFALFLTAVFAEEFAITQEYVDYLKAHVSWEVTDYEDNIFRGWTINELKNILRQEDESDIPSVPIELTDGAELHDIDWVKTNEKCVHEIKEQKDCTAHWAFTIAGVVSDRCCIKKKDYGWLSTQELISCDTGSDGCNGGFDSSAYKYISTRGLVPETCFPYQAKEIACPNKCVDESDWASAHVCKCGTIHNCKGVFYMAKCLESGPISAVLSVYKDFMNYKGGVYHWDKSSELLGTQFVRCVGLFTAPELHWYCANSWGIRWGEKGFFRIGTGEAKIDTYNPSYCDV